MSPTEHTIAIVEDDASFSRALERLLSASGYKPRAFASAEDFLACGSPGSYDALILDVQLPGMSGFELLERLNTIAAPRPAIFITAFDEEGARERAEGIPGCAYLRKPFVSAVLLDALQSLPLRHNSEAGPPSRPSAP